MISKYKAVILLCLYGFCKELRPSEPFLTEYLLGPWKNLTEEQVFQEIYPVWTYSYLVLLIGVFLLTDLLRYKPIIVLEGFAYIGTWLLLIFGQSVGAFQAVEFFYAVASSTEVAYSTYVYAQKTPISFEKLTGYTQGALLTGRCLAGVISQVLVATKLCDFYSLNFISLGAVSVATCFAIALPSVPRSIYFYRDNNILRGINTEEKAAEDGESATDTGSVDNQKEINQTLGIFHGWSLIKNDFKVSYSKNYVVKWSVWWAFAMCINLQVLNYIQPLWETIAPAESNSLYNGAVEALQNILSAGAALGVTYLNIRWSKWGEAVLAIVSVADGFILLVMAWTKDIWVAYAMYIAFKITYQILITVASAEVAKQLAEHCYGLVFGINTFAALLLQTILTTIVASGIGFALPPDDQFVVYGGYFLVLGGVFSFMAAYGLGARKR